MMTLEQALFVGGGWAVPLAAIGGMVAGLNPCCVVFYPAVAAACCTRASAGLVVIRWRAAAFLAGTTLATMSLGVIAAAAGHAAAIFGRGPRYALAFVPILAGLHLLGGIRLSLPSGVRRGPEGTVVAAFLTGLSLSLLIGSCATPVLGAILSYAAYKGSMAFGALLLLAYGLGNGLPLVLLGAGAGIFAARFSSSAHAWIDRLAGAVLVGLGFYLLAQV